MDGELALFPGQEVEVVAQLATEEAAALPQAALSGSPQLHGFL